MKLNELVEKILKANVAYRKGEEIMTDEEYDKMLNVLRKFAPGKYNFIRQMVLDGAPEKNAVELPVVVGSLEKLKNGHDIDINKWVSKQSTERFIVTSKVDGLSLLICYYDGDLRLISTRGDGKIGENKTDKLRSIVPAKLNGELAKGFVVIRGECVMTSDAFEKIQKHGFVYRAKRNAAIGLVNSKDSQKNINLCGKYLIFIAYQIYKSEKSFSTYYDIIDELELQGFVTPIMHTLYNSEMNSKKLMELYGFHKRHEEFDIDGLVIQNDNQFNEIDKVLPEHSIAFKANQLNAITEIEGFEWDVSKDGSLRPVAVVKPVELNGVMVTRASAFNYDWIKENKCGIGAIIELQMQGDIIPGINSIIETSDKIDYPEKCTYCGGRIREKGKFLYCTNPACKARAVKSIAHFLNNLDIGFASDVNLTNWKIFSINDLIEFISFKSDSKQQQKFISEFKTKFWNISEQKLIESFDYSGIGKKIINKIIEANSVDAFVNYFFKEDNSIVLNKVNGITDMTFKRIANGIKFNDLVNVYHTITYNDNWHKHYSDNSFKTISDETLKGKSFCFTGALTIPRKLAESLVKAKGGEVKSAVNSSLTYLVTNEPNLKTTKNKKAIELGISVISEKTFFSIVEYELPESLKTIAAINESIKKNKNKPVKDSIDDL